MITHAKSKRFLIAAIALAVPLIQAMAQGRIEAGLDRVGPAAVRIAIPEFHFAAESGNPTARLAKTFNDTLWNDLDFTGNL